MLDLGLLSAPPSIEGSSPHVGSRRQARLYGAGAFVYLSTIPGRPNELRPETYGTLGRSVHVIDVRMGLAHFVSEQVSFREKHVALDQLSTALIDAVPARFKPWRRRLGSARGSSLILTFQYPIVAEWLTVQPATAVPPLDELTAVALGHPNMSQLAKSLLKTEQRVPRPIVRQLRDVLVQEGVVATHRLKWLSALSAGLSPEALPELLAAMIGTAVGAPPTLRPVDAFGNSCWPSPPSDGSRWR